MADILERYLQAQSLSATKLSVWSLVVTIFGDAIAPRGGVLRLGALQQITEHIGIGSNALRTAMSRLASDGWLERERIGRASYYRPSAMAARENVEASKVIYTFFPKRWNERWLFALSSNGEGFSALAKRQLQRSGFVLHSRKLAIAPQLSSELDAGLMENQEIDLFEADTLGKTQPKQLFDQINMLHDCDDLYLEFSRSARILQEELGKSPKLRDIDSMLLRTLLLHQWRRIVLKDFFWPRALYPEHWPGFEAQQLVSAIYHQLLIPSEDWLSSLEATPQGRLPPPNKCIFERFKL